jgi:FAD/FMN-containing dehydrogenase
MKKPVASWGRLSADMHQVVPLRPGHVSGFAAGLEPGVIYGNGRSYGDVCLNPNGLLWMTKQLDHLISFDSLTGVLTCESGVLLGDIQRTCIPQGWCLPVTPGTQYVTVGGAIANDVHGKNHHRNASFGNYVCELNLLRTNGEQIICGPDKASAWFGATVGGLGLTGLITQATLQLQPVTGPWLETETIPYVGLDEFIQLAEESEVDWEYTVSWVDCLSGSCPRGIFMRANHAEASIVKKYREKQQAIPITPPLSLVNRLSLKPLNVLYYWAQKRKRGSGISHYQPFFYPLDGVQNWNQLYGPKGFYQYQLVVPRAGGKESVAAVLQCIADAGQGSFLSVLKTFGEKKSLGLLSFPQPGITLALDFPNKGERVLSLLRKLDAIVSEAGGHLYPAKDARMSAEFFAAGYPMLNEFLNYKDPGISSAFSRRVMGV